MRERVRVRIRVRVKVRVRVLTIATGRRCVSGCWRNSWVRMC